MIKNTILKLSFIVAFEHSLIVLNLKLSKSLKIGLLLVNFLNKLCELGTKRLYKYNSISK